MFAKLSRFFLRSLILFCCSLQLFTTTPAIAETITIAGTGDSQTLLCQLAQAFRLKNPGAQVLIPNSVGSGGGIKLLLAGHSELARIARPLKPKEQASGLQHRIFAYSPIVFVANLPDPCLQSVSASEIKDIFRGSLNNWNQLGSCKEHKIYVANREDGDSSRSVLEQKIPGLKEIEQLAGRTIYSTPETYDTINRYPYSFGYLPKSQVLDGHLTILDYEGIAPSVDNVQNGHYPLVVPLGIVWRGEPTGVTKQFIDFLTTVEARDMMLRMHAIPTINE